MLIGSLAQVRRARPLNRFGTSPALARLIVLLVTGQSNDKGRNPGLGTGGGITEADIAPDPRIKQWTCQSGALGTANDTLIEAHEPLSYPGAANEAWVGPIMRMAKDLLAGLGPNDQIVILPLATGGTDLAWWSPGGNGYTNGVPRISNFRIAAPALYPGYAIEWNFVGMTGEASVSDGTKHTAYLTGILASFNGMATDSGIGNDYGVITCNMSPAWVAGGVVPGNAIQSARIRGREFRSRFWVMNSPDGPYDPQTTNIHFNADAQAKANATPPSRGSRMAAKYGAMRARQSFDRKVSWCDGLSVAPYACFSLYRRLRAGYSGPALRVQRGSDSTTLDIGFDANGIVDFAAWETFVAGTIGFVVIWYDQSGNGRHFVQNASNTLPQIATNGQIHWRNAFPVMGGNSGHMIGNWEPPISSFLAIGDFPAPSGTKATFTCRNQSFWSLSAGERRLQSFLAGSATYAQGLPIPAGPHVIVGNPAAGTGARGWIDGVETTPLTDVAQSATLSQAGYINLLARQTTAGGAIDRQGSDLIGELVFADVAPWSDADRALVHAAAVAPFHPDPFT